jgi:hypothetical protein
VGWLNAWVQARTDMDDPRLAQPRGAYQQLKHRVWGGLVVALLLIVAIVVVGATDA